MPRLEFDLSEEPQYAYMFDQAYEFRKDVFLYKLADELDKPRLRVGVPRVASHLPYSIQDYENDPLNWKNTDGYTKEGIGKDDPSILIRSEVYGIIRAGTQFKIDKVVRVRLPSGRKYNTIYITVFNPKFKDCIIDGDDIFERYGSNANTLNESWVIPVQSTQCE